jgi:hypothetical protein
MPAVAKTAAANTIERRLNEIRDDIRILLEGHMGRFAATSIVR